MANKFISAAVAAPIAPPIIVPESVYILSVITKSIAITMAISVTYPPTRGVTVTDAARPS